MEQPTLTMWQVNPITIDAADNALIAEGDDFGFSGTTF